MSARVRTAVLPVAGLGTRFLPATKAMPKEMLTVVDRPVLQYVVDEAREAGIENFVFVTGRGKGVIEDHFDRAPELEDTLKARGKDAALKQIEADMLGAGQAAFTRQQEPLGLGHAVWCARHYINNEPFAVLLPDTIMAAREGGTGCMAQLMAVHEQRGGNVISVEECDPSEAHKYGIVSMGAQADDSFEITGMVEKPEKGAAPSNRFVSGRYILQPEIMDILENQPRGAGNEIQLTDAMLTLMDGNPFRGVTFQGHTFDGGAKLGYLEAQLHFGLRNAETAEGMKGLLRDYGASVA